MAAKEDFVPAKEAKKKLWQQIKVEYVTTDISMRELAAKYNISESTIFKRSGREKWKEEKDNIAAKIGARVESKLTQKVIEKHVERKATQIVDEIDYGMEASNAIMKLIHEAIQGDPKQFYKQLIKKKQIYEDGSYEELLEEKETNILDSKRLDQISKALDTVTKLNRTLKEIVDAPVKKKLELEERKVKVIEQDAELPPINEDEEENQTGVVFLPEIREGEA